MGIFKKEKMRFKEIVKELDQRIMKCLNPKDEEINIFVVQVPCRLASLEIDGYLKPKTVKKVSRYFRERCYKLKVYVSGDIKHPDDPTCVSFKHPKKICKIEVYDY